MRPDFICVNILRLLSLFLQHVKVLFEVLYSLVAVCAVRPTRPIDLKGVRIISLVQQEYHHSRPIHQLSDHQKQ